MNELTLVLVGGLLAALGGWWGIRKETGDDGDGCTG